MLLLYVLVLSLLALLQVLVRWRVARLERRYARVAADADALLKASAVRPGNGRSDPLLCARQQYELACLAVKRERVEHRYTSWQSFSERFAAFRGRLAGYRGKVVPYVFGALDVAFVLVILDQAGLGVEQVRAWLGV